MTSSTATTTGRKVALGITGIITLLLVIVFIFRQTSGDFANGILFALQYLTSAYVLLFLCILFSLTWLLGAIAGKAILLGRKHFILSGILCGGFIAAALFGYIVITINLANPGDLKGSTTAIFKTYLRQLLSSAVVIILLLLPVMWIAICYRIKCATDKNTGEK
ncbi:MAG: hypothetical protein QM731_13965 [Chitinophagaceae bacterium]